MSKLNREPTTERDPLSIPYYGNRHTTPDGRIIFENFSNSLSFARMIDSEELYRLNLRKALPEDMATTPDKVYWGWQGTGDTRIVYAYPSKYLLNGCFPNGVDSEVESGNGTVHQFIIESATKTK